MSYAPHPTAQAAAEPTECTQCGRPLKRPSVDGLGPVCRRKLRAARAEDTRPAVARQPVPGQFDVKEQQGGDE